MSSVSHKPFKATMICPNCEAESELKFGYGREEKLRDTILRELAEWFDNHGNPHASIELIRMAEEKKP